MSTNIDSFKEELERQICNKRSANKKLIEKIREFLNNDQALNKSQLYTYRKFGFSDSFFQGAATGFLFHREISRSSSEEICHINKEVFNDFFGITFDQINYNCDLKLGKSFPESLDAEIFASYVNPIVSKKLGSSIIKYKSLSDCDSIQKNNYKFKLDVFGDGITVIDGGPKITLMVQKGKDKIISKQIQTIYRLLIDASNNHQKRTIRIKKYGKNMFDISKKKHDTAGIRILRPTSKLKLQLNFPKNIFKNGLYPKVDIIVCEDDLLDIAYIDYRKMTSILVGENPVQQIAPGCYEWVSKKTPLVGMHYALIYFIDDVKRCLV